MKPRARYIVITGHKWQTLFMQKADLFDDSKIVGEIQEITISWKPGMRLTMARATKHIKTLKKGLELIDHIFVPFIHLAWIQRENTLELNGGRIKPWFDPAVRMVSNGKSFFFMDSYIKSLGFLVKTNEMRYIQAVESFNEKEQSNNQKP